MPDRSSPAESFRVVPNGIARGDEGVDTRAPSNSKRDEPPEKQKAEQAQATTREGPRPAAACDEDCHRGVCDWFLPTGGGKARAKAYIRAKKKRNKNKGSAQSATCRFASMAQHLIEGCLVSKQNALWIGTHETCHLQHLHVYVVLNLKLGHLIKRSWPRKKRVNTRMKVVHADT